MALYILRSVFLLVAIGASTLIIKSPLLQEQESWVFAVAFLGVCGLAVVVIAIDMLVPKKRIDTISCVYFGLIVGLFLTYVAGIAMNPLLVNAGDKSAVRWAIQLITGMTLCYACISLLLQTKNDFHFIIPYIEFSKEVKGLKPYILDTSVVIDGRIADMIETHVLDSQMIMPRFVLAELQNIADSSDKMRRERGRRGLDILNRLRNHPEVDLKIHDHETPDMANQPVDMKLALLAKHLDGKLVTGDYNLNKIAQLHNVPVINLNDIANALKPTFLPGEEIEVHIVKPGEGETQGVGYLEDGTMIVVEGGRQYINQQIRVTVTSVLQTSAGRMIFGRYESTIKPA